MSQNTTRCKYEQSRGTEVVDISEECVQKNGKTTCEIAQYVMCTSWQGRLTV